MKFSKTIVSTLFAATVAGALFTSPAIARTEIYFNTAPPENRVEVVPAPRKGYVWAPGYWNAANNRHVWKAGHWERERRGYHYVQPTWTQRDNRWQLERGRWNKGDRDGDGVPNRVDRAPDNPRRN